MGVKFEELVLKINDLTIRIKPDFIRLDTSDGLEADDYHLDFSCAEDVRKICKLMEK